MMLGFYSNAFEFFRSIAREDPRFPSVSAWLEDALVRAPNVVALAQPYGTPFGADTRVANRNCADRPTSMDCRRHARRPPLLPTPMELLGGVITFVKRHLVPERHSEQVGGATLEQGRGDGQGMDAATTPAAAASQPPEVVSALRALAAVQCAGGNPASSVVTHAASLVDALVSRAAADGRGGRRAPRCSPDERYDPDARTECSEIAEIEDALEQLHTAIHTHIHRLTASSPASPASPASSPSRLETFVLGILASLDWMVAVGRGMLSDHAAVLRLGFGAADSYDHVSWLLAHGCRKGSLKNLISESGHDLIFGYLHGDTTKPTCAAGVFIQGILNMFFNAHGPLLWKFNSGGTADVIFSPLYTALRRRGVRFHFFHKLTSLSPAGGGGARTDSAARTDSGDNQFDGKGGATLSVDRLEFDVQATLRAGWSGTSRCFRTEAGPRRRAGSSWNRGRQWQRRRWTSRRTPTTRAGRHRRTQR